MTKIAIIGAGLMGTALCWPLRDNDHQINLVGTPLDVEIIHNLTSTGVHPKLEREIPIGVKAYYDTQLREVIADVEVVISGVSSFGVNWFAKNVGPIVPTGALLLSVTKGLEVGEDGDLLTPLEAITRLHPGFVQREIGLNAIGGPCISHELAARRQTCVVFCGKDMQALDRLRALFTTQYYHVWKSDDVTGVEVSVALKNGYAVGVGLAMGMMETAGMDKKARMYNPQAALFAQSIFEIQRLLRITGGRDENVAGLPASGDLFVTIAGGRNVKLGSLLGRGYGYQEALSMLSGETLEGVEVIRQIARALPMLEARGLVRVDELPLIRHLDTVINKGEVVDIPWDAFFKN